MKSRTALLMALALAVSSVPPMNSVAAEQAYVTASSLNCRAEAYASSEILEKLSGGTAVTVVDRASDWANLDLGEQACWVASRYLSPDGPVISSFSSGGYTVRAASSASRKKASGGKAYLAAPSYSPPRRSSARRKKSSGGNNYGSSCPCSGNQVCIGPRGGRFCITSGGNKRYGV